MFENQVQVKGRVSGWRDGICRVFMKALIDERDHFIAKLIDIDEPMLIFETKAGYQWAVNVDVISVIKPLDSEV